MLFVARFEDWPERLNLRRATLAAHLGYLEARRDVILVAGSLREVPDADPVGGLWIIEAESREAAETLCREDPFWTVGLRKSMTLLHWWKAFPETKVPV